MIIYLYTTVELITRVKGQILVPEGLIAVEKIVLVNDTPVRYVTIEPDTE